MKTRKAIGDDLPYLSQRVADDIIATLFAWATDTTHAIPHFQNTSKIAEPEKRLMLAVLNDALYCLGRRRMASDYREACQWVLNPHDWGVFSFVSVCETLGFNPSALRKGIVQRFGLDGAARSATKKKQKPKQKKPKRPFVCPRRDCHATAISYTAMKAHIYRYHRSAPIVRRRGMSPYSPLYAGGGSYDR